MWRRNPVVDEKREKQNGDEELGRGQAHEIKKKPNMQTMKGVGFDSEPWKVTEGIQAGE